MRVQVKPQVPGLPQTQLHQPRLTFGSPGDQGAPGIGKLLAGLAILLGRNGDGGGSRSSGVPFILHQQLQRPLDIRGLARQHLHGRD